MNRLTIKEASHRLGVAEPTVRRRIRRGELEHGKGDDGRIWVCVPELVAVEPLFEQVEAQLEPVDEGDSVFEERPLTDGNPEIEGEPTAYESPVFEQAPFEDDDSLIDDEPPPDEQNLADAPPVAEERRPTVDERLIAEAMEAKDQLIAALKADRDRWAAEAANKQALIEVLIDQGENYQVLLHEAQAAVKRLSTPPPAEPPRRPVQEIELQRVSSRHEPDDDPDDDDALPPHSPAPQQPPTASTPQGPASPPDPEPPSTTAIVPQRKWWWR